MLTLAVLTPILASVLLFMTPSSRPGLARGLAIVVAAVPLAALAIVWTRYTPGAGFQLVEEAVWAPGLGVAWRMCRINVRRCSARGRSPFNHHLNNNFTFCG